MVLWDLVVFSTGKPWENDGFMGFRGVLPSGDVKIARENGPVEVEFP